MSNKSSYEQMSLYNPTLWSDPFLPLDRVFDNVISKTFPEFSKTFGIDAIQKASYPKVNIMESESEITFIAEVAGLSKEEVNVSIKDNEDNTKTLTISGKQKTEKKENVNYILRELKQSYFERSFVIRNHNDYNFDKVSAKHNNGVLTLSIPKTEIVKKENKIKHIDIE